MNDKKKEGSIFHVLIFSLPVIISQACDSLMMLTDGGKYGRTHSQYSFELFSYPWRMGGSLDECQGSGYGNGMCGTIYDPALYRNFLTKLCKKYAMVV